MAFLEGEAVELVRGVEHAILEHVVQLEIRLDLRFIEVVFGLADLLGVELPIPRLQLERRLLRVGRRPRVPRESRSASCSEMS